MKPWAKLLVIVGLAGFIGMFLPFLIVQRGPIKLGRTASQLTFRMEHTRALLDKQLPLIAELNLPRDVRSARQDARDVVHAARYAALLYIPAIGMLLAGLYGLWRKRSSRMLGAIGLMCGLASTACYFGLRYVLDHELDPSMLKRTKVDLYIGAHLLVFVGVLGILVGLAALTRPDPAPKLR
ncbi:MAG TPA: hypothetical protein VFQ53_26540 [Kofleriaceae bacterium]|nr:hypothetical protein [Kofleriaceae bacterium]